jgi:flavin reductase (DIM6/NTAB) family NADH-FMN oxidoreductase RutF
MATWDLREAVNMTSQSVEPDVDETRLAGLETVPSRLVKPPRVAASPVQLECLFHSASVLPGYSPDNIVHLVIGRVIGVHIRDDALTADGRIDVARIRPLARLGYFDYTSVDNVFTMEPTGPGLAERRKGLAGEAVGRPKEAGEAAE